MPIDYKKYPPNWKSEIRPRIMARANNTCEAEGCDFSHKEYVWSLKHKGKTIGWYRDISEILSRPENILQGKKVRVILTIAHLDHDETNHNVSDDRLKAMCQLCHLRYDASEKRRRTNKQH